MRSLFLVWATVAGLLDAVPPVAADDTLRFIVRVGGAEVGTLEETRSVEADGRIRTEEWTDLRIQRGTDAVRIRQTALWTESGDGILLRLDLRREGLGPTPWNDSIRRDPTGWIRSRSRGGGSAEDTLSGGDLLGPSGLDRLVRRIDAGATARTIDAEDLTPVSLVIERTADDTLATEFGSIACRVFVLRDSSRPGTESHQWRGPDGRVWKESEPSLGWTLERSGIRNEAPTEGNVDALYWSSLAVSGGHAGSGPCEFSLEPLGESLDGPASEAPPVPDTLGVEVVGSGLPDSWIVRIVPRRIPATTLDDRARWQASAELAPYLRDGLLIDASDALIQAFSGAAVRSAPTPTDEAILLEKAVHDRIAVRDLGTVFATASQTLRAGRGDCTEHAVLLAACCRARGIPSRLVAGFVPIGSRTMFHLWTEVYLNGWYPLDATLGTGGADPCAVPLRRWAQPEDGMRDLQEPIRRLAGRYRLVFPGEKG